MKTIKPKTLVAAALPREVDHLSEGEQKAMELSEESQHATGKARENMTKEAAKLSAASDADKGK